MCYYFTTYEAPEGNEKEYIEKWSITQPTGINVISLKNLLERPSSNSHLETWRQHEWFFSHERNVSVVLDENENPFTVLSVGREVVVRFNVNQHLDTLKQYG